MELRLPLAQYGSQLWTRERARDIAGRLADLLRQLEPGGVAVIDLKTVEVFDFSFANELFGKTLLALPTEYPGRFLVVEHLTTYTRENLERALESLNLAMIERKGRQLSLLGKLHPADRETFGVLAAARAPVTAAALKEQLGINLTAVNERLAKLVRLALVRREHAISAAGREQYEYRVLT